MEGRKGRRLLTLIFESLLHFDIIGVWDCNDHCCTEIFNDRLECSCKVKESCSTSPRILFCSRKNNMTKSSHHGF